MQVAHCNHGRLWMARPGRGKNVTIWVSPETAERMGDLKEVNWSQVCKEAIETYIDARKSVNPEARIKLAHLKQEEKKQGYAFGSQLALDLLKELTYDEVHRLRWDALSDEAEDEGWWDGPNFLTDWLADTVEGTRGFSEDSETRKKWRKKFDDWASKKGNFGWLLKMAERRKGLRKNTQFFQGMIVALREVLA